MYYVYMLECKDGSLYTGWTSNLDRRIKEHNSGKGAKCTRARLPVVLKYYEAFDTKKEAMQREYGIKQLSRQEKLELFTISLSPGNDEKAHIKSENVV